MQVVVAEVYGEEDSRSPPPQYPASEEGSSAGRPPPFSSLFASPSVDEAATAESVLERTVFDPSQAPGSVQQDFSAPTAPVTVPGASSYPESSTLAAETKSALPPDTKAESSSAGSVSRRTKDDEASSGAQAAAAAAAEPPPAYSEGSSPLLSFTYLMAAAGGASSIITQVQQGGPPINTLGDVAADETITMDLRYGNPENAQWPTVARS